MKITNELIDHIAHLSRLEFDGEAKEIIKQDVGNMIDFVDQLNKVDTENVEPLIFMTESWYPYPLKFHERLGMIINLD